MSPAQTNLPRWLTLAAIVAFAFWVRTHELARRPMHADEANQAVKLGELIEAGRYAFDPRDHHGPTLYYAALPIAWLRGQRTLAALDETTVRLVPAIFGTASVVLLAFLGARRRGISNSPQPAAGLAAPGWPALAAAAFLAVSPPAVYFSRYFIQETLLVTFTLGALVCGGAWWRTGRLGWAIGAGVCAGLMQATKATAPLFLAAALGAFLVARGLSLRRHAPSAAMREPSRPWTRAGVAFGLSFLAAAALLYSSFGTNLSGLRDALGAYVHAATRFGAESPPTGHEKPWWYYLRMFGWFKAGGLVWHQLALSVLAVAGLVLALIRRRRDPFLLFAATFTFVVTLAFSIFAYKTPWHAVHFSPGLALLAAAAVAAIGRLQTGRLVAVAFTLITIATLFQQTQRVAFARPADQRNPYAYVHSSPDVLKYRAIADAAIARAPDQPIRVISEEYWPLPWYLRGIPQVGYYATPPDNCDGALVVASMTQVEAVRAKLKRTYRESFLGLRPGVVCILFTLEP